jgi:hypothetical protein
MRIWTLHPKYLDRQGLTAVWRESLLAQAVLLGKTKGYRHHPQLKRFLSRRSPAAAIATYLDAIQVEAGQRGYSFDRSRIGRGRMRSKITETDGQLMYEWSHLLAKLKQRSPDQFERIRDIKVPDPHPLFEIIPGNIRDWEKR